MRSISPRWIVIGCILVIWAALSLSAEAAIDSDPEPETGIDAAIGIVE